MAPSHPTNVAGLTFRPTADVDRPALEALVTQSFATTRFGEIPSYSLRAAFERPTPEAQGIIADRDGVISGFALFGDVAGTMGTGKLHFVGVPAADRRRGIGAAVCEAAVSTLFERGARSVVAEIPDHPLLAGGRALLARCGFREAGSVAGYFSDGVDLLVLQRFGP
jgi:ribosomal protein S18 acetylase RimI-like enzyme